jgi:hypothetical protein
MCFLWKREREEKKKNDYWQQTIHQSSSGATPGGKGRRGAFKDMAEGRVLIPGGVACADQRAWTPPTHQQLSRIKRPM